VGQERKRLPNLAVIPREGGESSSPRLLGSVTGVTEYWITRLRG